MSSRKSVELADGLVANVVKRIAEQFANEREELEKQWDRGVETSIRKISGRRSRAIAHFSGSPPRVLIVPISNVRRLADLPTQKCRVPHPSLFSSEGWDSTNPNQGALYQGMTSQLGEKPEF